ncbi:hypothetical protein H5P28_15035 [Ruficoccus amylovorans]|uniref:Uncharacterized protein n=1 Tax=Ruficoccus amylovorans TaxID=1804625 RepID=A0A842HHD0_9BACT|nr:hypothetical protein [Ruficoccus amylovorans]MBC2595580.1 hypothetical protein [Ruficoccus amylovorans]
MPPPLCPQNGTRTVTPAASRSRGFALIVAMVLMGFILLLILSLSSLARVSTHSAALKQKQQIAELNALMGLNMAIAQLQTALGPDQRVSARADITTAPDGTSPPSHPFWTGVWRTQAQLDEDGAETGEEETALLTYLVSGNENALVLDAEDAELGANAIIMVAGNGSTDAPEILAQKVTIADGNSAYAYWISDEGIKAKINLPDISSQEVDIVNQPLLAPSQYGITQVDGLSAFPSDSPQLSTILTLESLELLTEADPTDYFHDLTTYSFGVLSDARHGGLKKDLTAGLQASATEPTGQIFGPLQGTWPASENPGGPRWSQLRSWVNTELVGGGTRGSLPVRAATDDTVGYAPVITGWEFTTMPTRDSADQIFLHFMPVVSLWNPYDVPLQSATYKVRITYATLDSNLSAGYSYRPTTIDSRRILRFYIQLRKGDEPDHNPANDEHYTFEYKVNISEIELELPNVTLQPGQSKVYSLQENVDLGGSKSSSSPWHDYNPETVLTLGEGLPAGYFYRLPLLDSSKQPVVLSHYTSTGGDPELMTAYRTSDKVLPRAISLELIHANTALGGDEILSANYYLKHGEPSTGALPYGDLQAYTYSNSSPLPNALRNHSWGYKASRTWTQLPDRGTAYPAAARLRWLADFNPRAFSSGPLPFNYANSAGSVDTYPAHNPSYFTATEYTNNNFGEELEGVGYSADYAVDNAILFEAPYGLDSLFSIGQLANAPLYYYNDDNRAPDENDRNASVAFFRERNSNSHFDNQVPAYPIGNSRAHVAIPTDQTYRDWGALTRTGDNLRYFNFRGLLYDYSYLLNDALWDSYFFSTLTNLNTTGGENDQYAPRNPRLVALDSNATEAPDLSASAENLLIDGAFNINSTSVEAWKALLSSTLGKPVTLTDGSSEDTEPGQVPLPRLSAPATTALPADSTNAADAPLAYTGYRALTQEQISRLADEIVKQVRLRGPFTSLGQFVNRTLLASDEHERHLRGALDAAIQNADINAALTDGVDSSIRNRPGSVPAANWYGTESGAGYTTENVPGWLSQADVLARLGSVLSARSDTFLIRAYGEYRAPFSSSGSPPESYAYCEAVVQRLPAYTDSSQRPDTEDSELSDINKAHGRRFVVVSFRWLSKEDI